VSPEREPELLVAEAIASARRRARVLALGEGLAWAAAVAAISPLAGALVGVAVAAWRWRTTTLASVVRALERAQPDHVLGRLDADAHLVAVFNAVIHIEAVYRRPNKASEYRAALGYLAIHLPRLRDPRPRS